MTPEELFDTYREKAERIAQSLCWHFQVSGALSHQEEAKSEALLELWRRCQAFDPHKQAFENRKESGSNFWLAISGCEVPTKPSKDPYANFWMWAITRVRGRVMDYFRSEKLITRIQRNDQNPKRTMLYHERFLSGSSPVVTEDGSVLPCYLEQFPSKDRADADDEMSDNRTTIRMIMGSAALTEFESQVVTLFYADNDKKEIAAELGQPQSWVNETLKSAIYKMRVATGQESIAAPKNG